jgi:hypothetical protein
MVHPLIKKWKEKGYNILLTENPLGIGFPRLKNKPRVEVLILDEFDSTKGTVVTLIENNPNDQVCCDTKLKRKGSIGSIVVVVNSYESYVEFWKDFDHDEFSEASWD